MKSYKDITPLRYATYKNDASLFALPIINGRGYGGRPLRRGFRRRPQLLGEMKSEHGKRLVSFSLIGFGVFVAGLGLQVVLVQVAGLPKVPVYIGQLILSVQVNFLANYHWTWGDRNSPFWRSCWRYNVKRAAGTLVNAGLYPILVHCGMNYLAANALLVVALTPVNYVLGHFWTFRDRQQPSSGRHAIG
jgi:putative flippase GtrA